MITIVEPQKHIVDLWGKPTVQPDEEYRLMRYVIKTEYQGRVLLHNVVTGHLVLLDHEEISVLNRLSEYYSSAMRDLVEWFFLIPCSFDEHRKVAGMRIILKKLYDLNHNSGIVKYTIFPTTACNARCYYCFEKGSKIISMTEQTAADVVRYIALHRKNHSKVFITWFGGEPTLGEIRIDQICLGLCDNGIEYSSDMITNGYLFDEEMIRKAKNLWHLRSLQISVDGTESRYNQTKAFVNVKDNPYQRLMRNIGLLLENSIYVDLRMNFDIVNYKDFAELVDEIIERFGKNPYLQFHVHPVIGSYEDMNGSFMHGSSAWFEEKIVELNAIVRSVGLWSDVTELQHLQYKGCQASNLSTITINADGTLVRCPEQFGESQIIGDLKVDVDNESIVNSWMQLADYQKCWDCPLYPACDRLLNCSAKDRCYHRKEFLLRQENAACFCYNKVSNIV